MNILFWLSVVWTAWIVSTIWFYGVFMLFKSRHLCADEVADRVSDGRMFRDMLFPFLAFPVWELPGLLLAATVFPFAFTVRRLRVLKRIRKRWQEI